jgi:hypothetical protein
MYDTAGIAITERQRYDEQLIQDAPGWIMRIFFGDETPQLRAPVLRAIEDFGALIVATREAHRVVSTLSSQLVYIIGGIEAAYRYHDKVLVVELTMDEQVSLVLESLKRLKQDVEKERIQRLIA